MCVIAEEGDNDPFFSRLFRCRNNCRCFCVELVKFLPEACFDLVLVFFHILVLRKYWVLMENRIPLLEGVRIVAHSISSHEQTQ